jgi:aspartyl-tRNA(Asn)/glutamyl-tRNA(Gln) amidotransferase subunit B
MEWEVVIGLETHAQLSTASKIFSGASTAFGAQPNTQACAFDLALPGVLPVLNKGAVECAIKFGLAVGGSIAPRSVFARKNYFYPDLPKGYQISQYELPVVTGGEVRIQVEGVEKVVHLTRAHLEEDAGKSLHEGLETNGVSGIDLNRAGTPLLEIVTEPEMRSAQEAVAYAKALHGLVTWLDICDGNMQEGSFRCDANVSVRPKGSDKLGTRCEIKNLNSFRFLEESIEFEVRRQIELIEAGGSVAQETRLYDSDKKETRSMRSKEDAMDYRYFPDPDLLPLEITEDWVNEIRDDLPELPAQRRQRYIDLGLSDYDANALTMDRGLGDYFESVSRYVGPESSIPNSPTRDSVKTCANWVINEISARLNEEALPSWKTGITADTLGMILRRMIAGVINAKTAKSLVNEFWDEAKAGGYKLHGGHPQLVDELIERRGLQQVSDTGAIEKIVDEVIAANPKSAEEYRSGKDKAINSLVGQVMKASKGKANPAQATEILKKRLMG